MRVLAEEDELQNTHPRRRKMRKIDQETVEAIRTYVVQHPELVYSQVATSFSVSVATVKRLCTGGGREKISGGDRGSHWKALRNFGTKLIEVANAGLTGVPGTAQDTGRLTTIV